MKDKLVFIYILLFLVLLISVSGCRNKEKLEFHVPSISRSILTESPITIGDPIDVALIIYHHKSDRIVFPENEESFSPFTLKDMIVKKRRLKSNVYKTMIIYTITLFDTGDFKLKPFEVIAGEEVLETDLLDISILSVLPKNEENPDLKDIVPPYRPKIRPITVIIICSAFIGSVAVMYFTWKFFSQKKDEELKPVSTESQIDPYEYSIKELQSLKSDLKDQLEDTKTIYSKMSFVLRFFTGRMLNFAALQMTTNQIKKYIRRKGENHFPLPRLITILKSSDMVKFAKEKPQGERVKYDIDESIDIIDVAHRSFMIDEETRSDDV